MGSGGFAPAPASGSYKTVMCKYAAQGTCTKGDACTFAHDESELSGGSSLSDGQPKASGSWKTALCKYFPEGKCMKGEACNYAHGATELQAALSVPSLEARGSAGNPVGQGWGIGTNGNSWGIIVPSLD